ncbi:MAG: PIN domain-containing protein [Alphaproteobacteria bacterium]|nr:MAG: PIN domain-containing protein [Alphaproteobacteria bacterium]
MADFVLDASVALAWLFEDEIDTYAEEVERCLREGRFAAVPTLWHYEIVNAILSAERRRRLTSEQADLACAALGALPLEIDPHPLNGAALLALGRRAQLSAYDAAYLELSQRLCVPLATRDRRLSTAAEAVAVPLFRP